MVNPLIAAAGIQAGAGLLGGLFGDSGPSSRTIRRRGRNTIENYFYPLQQTYFGKAQRAAESVPGMVREGFKTAKLEAGDAYRGAARETVERGKATEAQAKQSLISSGFSMGSRAINAAAGIGAHTSRALQSIRDAAARTQSGLTTAGATAEAEATSRLSDVYRLRGTSELDTERLRFGLMTGQFSQSAPQPSLSGGGLGLLSYLALAGGGGGGGPSSIHSPSVVGSSYVPPGGLPAYSSPY